MSRPRAQGLGGMITLRRFLVLAALMFWQGGFTFYAAVVVPIGQRNLGPVDQGFLTREVTQYLNLAGAVALGILVWDLVAPRTARRQRLRWLSWLGMVVSLLVLAWLHHHLDGLLDLSATRVVDRRHFRAGHRAYLWMSTFQWACGVTYCWLALRAWRIEDHRASV